jgi:predicted Zn finger-like uncharacterized protein
MAEHTSTHIKCPHCAAAYRVVHIEAQSDPVEIACRSCGGPLAARDGKFLLKYFLVDKRRRANAPAEAAPLQMSR